MRPPTSFNRLAYAGSREILERAAGGRSARRKRTEWFALVAAAAERLGQSAQWPSPEAERYYRIGEYYFPDEGALTAFVESALFQEIAGLCRELGEATLPVATEPQEVFFTTLGQQPLSEGWLAFAREAR